MEKSSFGEKLKTLRLKRGLSQKQLADILFVTRRCIGNWEAGRRKPDINTLSMLSKIFDVDMDYFFNDSQGFTSLPEVILVENEEPSLENYAKLIKAVIPMTHVVGFTDIASASEFVHDTVVSIAFLDIEAFGENGLEFSKKLIELNPMINVIFFSSDHSFAAEALEIFCSGYMIKPLTKRKISDQIRHLRYPVIIQSTGKIPSGS